MSMPRVAVIGGGISGTLCALVLRSRGLVPVVFDEASSIGGRNHGGNHPNSGVQFIRVTDARFLNVMEMMRSAGIVQEWKGRFGFLGSKGGYLSSDIVGSSSIHAMGKENDVVLQGNDEGDFCGFVHNRGKTYIGNPSMKSLCSEILRISEIEVHHSCSLLSASPPNFNHNTLSDHWSLTFSNHDKTTDFLREFDGLVIATQDPNLAADVVDKILQSVGNSELVDQWEAIELQMNKFSTDLRKVSASKLAGCTLSAYYPLGSLSSTLPFDAVSLPSSSILQFLSRDRSRNPSISDKGNNEDYELWTAVATAQFSESLRSNQTKLMIKEPINNFESINPNSNLILVSELSKLLSYYYQNDEAIPQPIKSHTTFWDSGFMGRSLNLSEDCVGLEPWRVAVAGDYISKMTSVTESGPSSPFEAAALSGLEAGERLALFLK